MVLDETAKRTCFQGTFLFCGLKETNMTTHHLKSGSDIVRYPSSWGSLNKNGTPTFAWKSTTDQPNQIGVRRVAQPDKASTFQEHDWKNHLHQVSDLFFELVPLV